MVIEPPRYEGQSSRHLYLEPQEADERAKKAEAELELHKGSEGGLAEELAARTREAEANADELSAKLEQAEAQVIQKPNI